MSIPRRWKVHALLGALAPGGWALVHLFEQWSAFEGRTSFVTRFRASSFGSLALAAEVGLAILPTLAWIALELRLRFADEEPKPLAVCLAEDPDLALRLGKISTMGSRIFYAWMLLHISGLWLPKLVHQASPEATWTLLRMQMGTWTWAIVNAIGLTAFAVHLASSLPRLVIALDWAQSPKERRAIRVTSLLFALVMLLFYAQLTGLHASGTGSLLEFS